MADKFPAMLCHKFNVRKIKDWPVVVEPKLDGIRCLIIVKHVDDEYEIATYSRAGKTFNSLIDVEDAILDTFAETSWDQDMVFDGEVFAVIFNLPSLRSRGKRNRQKMPFLPSSMSYR